MTEAERAAAQGIFAEQVKTYEARLREQERTFTAIIQELEAEKTGLNARVRELEQQRVELAELAIYNNGCFDCPLEDVCLYKEELVRDSAVCSRLLIEWVEKAAKEAGK